MQVRKANRKPDHDAQTLKKFSAETLQNGVKDQRPDETQAILI
jgi:hypothetical protein